MAKKFKKHFFFILSGKSNLCKISSNKLQVSFETPLRIYWGDAQHWYVPFIYSFPLNLEAFEENSYYLAAFHVPSKGWQKHFCAIRFKQILKKPKDLWKGFKQMFHINSQEGFWNSLKCSFILTLKFLKCCNLSFVTAQYLKTNIAMQEGWMDGWKTPYLDGMNGWWAGKQG